jgi:hypothetical protein
MDTGLLACFLEIHMNIQTFKKSAITAAIAGAGMLALVEPAAATSVMTSGMTTALDTGFTDLKDTVADVIASVWPYMLTVLGLYAAPTIVKKLYHLAAR